MKIKKFQAKSLQLAMKQVNDELGREAVILSSKRVDSKGFLSLFKKPYFELIAATEEKNTNSKIIESSELQTETVTTLPNNTYSINDKRSDKKEDLLLLEIQEIKKVVANSKTASNQSYIPEPINQIAQLLKSQELTDDVVEGMVNTLLKNWYKSENTPSLSLMKSWLKEHLHEQLQPVKFGGINDSTKYVFLFGPTGVGKTTTIAKLAGDMVLRKKKTVAFITLDTYRIGAVEQLKTYASILQAPLKVCYDAKEFETAKKELQSYDVIFIDTAGRNFFDKQNVFEIESFFTFDEYTESFLVLSATSKYVDMINLIGKFEQYPIKKMIFTKCDETRFHGPIFNLLLKRKLDIAYITNGQNVPEDILETDEAKVVDMILGGI